jgi:hypothetical protein
MPENALSLLLITIFKTGRRVIRVKRVKGLLAKAEQFLARQRIDYSYQELFIKTKTAASNQTEFNRLMKQAREQYLNQTLK